MSIDDVTPRIYVACMAAYNHGIRHGVWIDATLDPNDIRNTIQTMLKASPIEGAEEFAIHAHEGFYSLKLSERERIDHIHAIASFIAKHGELGAELIVYTGIDHAGAVMSDGDAACYRIAAEFAKEFTAKTTQIPEKPRLLYRL